MTNSILQVFDLLPDCNMLYPYLGVYLSVIYNVFGFEYLFWTLYRLVLFMTSKYFSKKGVFDTLSSSSFESIELVSKEALYTLQ